MPEDTTPPFFISFIDAEKQEESYAQIARFSNSQPSPEGQRIYSIVFDHNGVEWTATVGEKLTGIQWITKRSRGQVTEHKRRHSDNATVLAIFPGYPFHVCHDNNRSHWNNPFYVGTPKAVRRFR